MKDGKVALDVVLPVLGVIRVKARTPEELRERLAELREASCDW
jgi:protein involved in polysaccharide export with SLBB domain